MARNLQITLEHQKLKDPGHQQAIHCSAVAPIVIMPSLIARVLSVATKSILFSGGWQIRHQLFMRCCDYGALISIAIRFSTGSYFKGFQGKCR